MLGGMYWKGGTRSGALAGLLCGFVLWVYTLMLPSLAKSGWLAADFLTPRALRHRAAQARAVARPARSGQPDALAVLEPAGQRRRLRRRCRCGARRRRARPARRCCSSTCSSAPPAAAAGVLARPRAAWPTCCRWLGRFLGHATRRASCSPTTRGARARRASNSSQPDARLVQFVETQLAGAIGSASARVMVASVVRGGVAGLDDVMRILDEASQLRAYSHALEDKSRSLERATAELRSANEQLKSLDRLKDDFMSSVTHELRTPLTSIRALAELMVDDADMAGRAAPAVPGHHRRRDRAPEPAGEPGAGHGQDRVRPCRVAQQPTSTCARCWRRRCRPRAEMFRERGASVELRAARHGAAAARRRRPADAGDAQPAVQRGQVRAARRAAGCRCACKRDSDGLTVAVQDNGPGVPAEQRALIFEKFRQGGDAAEPAAGHRAGPADQPPDRRTLRRPHVAAR